MRRTCSKGCQHGCWTAKVAQAPSSRPAPLRPTCSPRNTELVLSLGIICKGTGWAGLGPVASTKRQPGQRRTQRALLPRFLRHSRTGRLSGEQQAVGLPQQLTLMPPEMSGAHDSKAQAICVAAGGQHFGQHCSCMHLF